MDYTDVQGAKAPLKESEAVARAKQVSNIAYKLKISLDKGKETFDGAVDISFDSKTQSDDLFLDFNGKRIHELKVNGTVLSDASLWKSSRVHLPKANVKVGQNQVSITYTNDYSTHGEGLHHFIDPQDKEEYLYTNFEPYYANMWAPCFDQPDLKATLELTVTAPEAWKVIANSKASSEPKTTADGRKEHHFLPTQKISTYLFAMVAGPFESYHDSFDNGRIPLGLYCRKSLAKYLDADELFLVTKQGFAFYEEFFAFKYPFSKYDQLFCPEFNQGAMENVGCVTFTEQYIFKDKPTVGARVGRADTVLHEMAHMWFGNLVSPVWWSGLWLNESFATYSAALAVASATSFGALSWQEFLSGMKAWAYREDQLITTHPIEGEVSDTDQTFLNFDGITYGKGASLLKQLVHVVGMEGFKTGMRYYFNKYQWGNTTIAQFLEAIEHGSHQVHGNKTTFDAKSWSHMWLERAGLNSLQPVIELKDKKIASFAIALFDLEGNKVHLRKAVDANILAQPLTHISSLDGEAQPAFVYINYNDHAFVKCLFDARSEEFALANLERFEDPLLRNLLWMDLYNCVRDASMKSTAYLKLVRDKLGFEDTGKLVQSVVRRANASLINFVPSAQRPAEADAMFDFYWTQLQKATEEEWQIIWANAVISVAETNAKVEKLVEYLKEGSKITHNFALDQGMRWSVVVRATAHSLPNADALLEAEQKRDPSDRGQRSVLSAKTSVPDGKIKEEAWKRYVAKEQKQSFHQMSSDMGGFRWFHQRQLVEPYTDKFFDTVRSIFKDHEREYAVAFFGSLFPSYPESDHVLNRARALLHLLHSEEEQILIRNLKEEIDDLERAQKALALFKHH